MIEEVDIILCTEELNRAKPVKIQIELSAWEAYSLIVAVQLFKVTHGSKLGKIARVGECAARTLHKQIENSCPATYRVVKNGWNLK